MNLFQIFSCVFVLQQCVESVPYKESIADETQIFVETLISKGLEKSGKVASVSFEIFRAAIPYLGVAGIGLQVVVPSELDEIGDKLDEHRYEIKMQLNSIERLLKQSFNWLAKESKASFITELQSKMKTEFEEFEHIISSYSSDEHKLLELLNTFIEHYRKQKYSTSIVNYLIQKSLGTESTLTQIYESANKDLKNNFNKKSNSPNRKMANLFYSTVYMVHKGNALLSYCYSLKDKLLNGRLQRKMND
jgi:hypothetical protein